MIVAIASLFIAVVSASASTAQLTASYEYNLADFSGPIPYMHAILARDNVSNEVYVMHRAKKNVRIFGETGMEIYRFGDEGEFAGAADLAVDDRGDIYILNRPDKPGTFRITQCNFRGEPQAEFMIQGIPEEFAGISPVFMEIVNEKIYFADPGLLAIIVADLRGNFVRGYNVQESLKELEEGDQAEKKTDSETGRKLKPVDTDFTGFNVDSRGNMYFTIATIFAAFRLSPDGTLESWGKPGSTPGSFGVAAGIATDDMGYIYIADKLRCVVIAFDSNLNYTTEFGFRGYGPKNLIVPNEVEVTRDGRIFVAQAASRGVSVFTVSYGRGVQ